MRNISILFIIAAFAITVLSCKKNSSTDTVHEPGTLLKTMKWNGKIAASFKYDNKNRLVEVTYPSVRNMKYVYDKNDRLIESTTYLLESTPTLYATRKFTYSTNRISVVGTAHLTNNTTKFYFELSNGRIIKSVFEESPYYTDYVYDNKGNLVRAEHKGPNADDPENFTIVYKYDDSKGLFSMVKGLNVDFNMIDPGLRPTYGVVNNIISTVQEFAYNAGAELTYEYNADGFPKSAKEKLYSNGNTYDVEYEYITQ